MSAYICNPEHFAALAAFACPPGNNRHYIREWEQPTREDTCAYVARQLAWHNIRSAAHRYPSDRDGEHPGPCMRDAEIMDEAEQIARHYHYSPPELSPVDILSMCMGYEYQACEPDDYYTTPASRQIQWIKSAAMRRLPGWEDAPWNFEDADPFSKSRPVSLMKFAGRR